MKALALVDAPEHVCCRYRLRAFEPALCAAGWTLTYQALAHGAFGRLAQFARASAFDLVILQRKLLPRWQLAALRRNARRLAFDFDDAVLYRDSYDPRGPHSRRRADRFGQTVRWADTVIAGNDFLADCALRAGAVPERVQVIPTCIETAHYPFTAPPADARPGLELVWIGSSSTLQGLERQRALWERVGREVPGVRVRVICDRFPSFEGLPVVPVHWSESREAAELAAGDVGISWVPDDLWSQGKCGLKVLQYQAAGLPVLANPVGVHPEMIEPNRSGFLPGTDDEWVNAVRLLADDPPLRARMRLAARANVDAYYSVAAWSAAFVAAVATPGARIPAPRARPFGRARAPARLGRRPHLGAKRAGHTHTRPFGPEFQALGRACRMKGGLLLGGQDRRHARPNDTSPPALGSPLTPSRPGRRPRALNGVRWWLARIVSWVIRTTPSRRTAERLFGPPDWSWIRTGDVGWWVRADWREPLIGPNGLRLDEWRRDGRLTVVKTGPHRVVYRVDLDQGAVFIKHFLVPDFRAKMRQWFRRGKGRNEGRRTRYLSAIGVPTITPVALGEQRKRFFLLENYLITHAIPDTVPLDEFVERRLPGWPSHRQARVRQNLATGLGFLTARLHDAGYVHQDFHPGNILVRMGEDDQPELSMIDLDALRVCHTLRWADAQLNLALLNHYFWLRCGRADRYRFLATYLQARHEAPPDCRAFARGIEESTRAWAERLWRRWGRRCCRTNKYFVKRREPKAHTWGVAVRDLDRTVARALLADPDSIFTRPGNVVHKDARTTSIAETTLSVGGQPTRVIYKRFNQRSWLDPFWIYFRPSRAWQSWQAGQHMCSRAIPTPRNLAFIARVRPFGRDLFWYLPHETYLITVKEEPSVTLGDYLRTVYPALSPSDQRAQIARLGLALARLMRTLHERSLSDRDVKASNILILGDPAAGDIQLSLIDLVGVRLWHPLPQHRRTQNLARLYLSLADVPGRTRTDVLRFLRAYLPWGLSPHNDWKSFWRALEVRGRLKRARNARHKRVLS